MPFTIDEIENIATSTLDFHMEKGKIFSQTIQSKPLLKMFDSNPKTFPGGNEFLTVRVKGDYTTTIQGWEGDDQVSFSKPNNMKTASYQCKRLHAGISVTYDELQRNGIGVANTVTGSSTPAKEGREKVALANLMEDKLEDLAEGRARDKNLMFWRDGSTDSSLVPGIQSFILEDPTSATVVGGIDQSTNTWWRNRALLNVSTATPSESTLAQAIQTEVRQLKRYGLPKHTIFAGADILDALEKEMRVNGTYTDSGWANKGSIDLSVADTTFKGVTINYDPTLDDEGKSKYMYILDMKAIYPMYMVGEKDKVHTPARPHNKFVLYRSVTDTCGLVCKQRNTSGIITIA